MDTSAHREWIAVGVDGSAASQAAVRYAASEAQQQGAGVRLIHVMPDYLPTSGLYGMTVTDLAPSGRVVLREAVEAASREWADVDVECSLVTGNRADALIEAAEGARELVLGHDPRPSLLRLATGSTAVAVAAKAPVPVVVVGPELHPSRHDRIVVGIKDVRRSYGLLRQGVEWAAQRGSSLHVVHAWELPPGYEDLLSTAAARDQASAQAVKALEEVCHAIAVSHPAVKYSVRVVNGNPARVLEEQSRDVDLLLLAKRRHALPRGHIGGTARALLRHSACPVVVLGAADEPLHLPVHPL